MKYEKSCVSLYVCFCCDLSWKCNKAIIASLFVTRHSTVRNVIFLPSSFGWFHIITSIEIWLKCIARFMVN